MFGQAPNKSTYSEPLRVCDSDPDFLNRVVKDIGIKPCACLNCRSCSANCPMYEYMDYGPHGIIRLVLMGFKRETLTSSTIWRCLGCDNCEMVCPSAINKSSLMDYLQKETLVECAWTELGC